MSRKPLRIPYRARGVSPTARAYHSPHLANRIRRSVPLRTFARFSDRRDAGVQLAQRLGHLAGRAQTIVLGLPRGGVPVAFEIAQRLRLPLDVFVVRKLGVPGHEELAMGAVASGGVRVLSADTIRQLGISRAALEQVTTDETAELMRRERVFRRGRPFPDLNGVTVVIVDDGIATGATMIAAVRAVRQLGPARVIVAAPIIAASTKTLLEAEADDVECIEAPEHFLSVGAWYEHFQQTTDAEVETLLRQPAGLEGPDALVAQTLEIPAPGGVLAGDLTVPHGAVALVVFAHGSGSSRLSPRNRDVAAELQKRGFATLLFDLLTPEEEAVDQYTAEFRFDIPRLARRLVAVTDWIAAQDKVRGLPIGYFGASTGAAAALVAASARPNAVHAVVSRGGRPDLADAALERVVAPTLLVVGSKDREVQTLNRNARHQMRNAHVELVIVPGASHLFEEPGTLAQAIRSAADWFETYLALPAPALAGGVP